MNRDELARWLTLPGGVSAFLRGARETAGLTGEQFAQRANEISGTRWTRSRVSKLESATQVPTAADVTVYAQLTDLDEAGTHALLRATLDGQPPYAVMFAAGAHVAQSVYLDLIRGCQHFWSTDRNVVPGELQTVAYATAVLERAARFHGRAASAGEIEGGVRVRAERQALLAVSSRRTEILVGEAALRTGVLDPGGMVEQCREVQRLATIGTASVGVLPLHQAGPMEFFPFNAFAGYDDRLVLVETPPRDMPAAHDFEVADFRRAFEAEAAGAVFGDAAVELVGRVADDWVGGV